MTKRDNIRNLLLPGIWQAQAGRAEPITDAEIEAVIDAFMAAASDGTSNNGVVNAKAKIAEIVALPLVIQKRQANLRKFKSVSVAYRQSQVPVHLRKEPIHDGRKSTKKAIRRTPQPLDPSWFGRTLAQRSITAPGNASNDSNPSNPNYLGFTGSSLTDPGFLAQRNLTGNIGNPYVNVPLGGLGGAIIPLSQALTINPVKDNLYAAPLKSEIKAGEILAWRVWRINPCAHDTYLSMTNETLWTVGTTVEASKQDLDNTFGIHAWKTRKHAEDYIGRGFNDGFGLAIGSVELWGEVIEHRDGYRAQYGAIKEIVERKEYPNPSGVKFADTPSLPRAALSIITRLSIWPAIIVTATWVGWLFGLL